MEYSAMSLTNVDIKNFLIAILLVLPSFAFVPLYVYLLLVPLMITRETKLDFNFYVIVLIILLCVINQMFNLIVLMRDFAYADIIPYTIFMIISYLFGRNVDIRVFHFVLIFISIEIFVGVLEYITEVKSFFPAVLNNITGEAPFGYKGLIYYKRVAGLSSNSSVFAYKIFIGILLLHYLKIKGKKLLVYGSIFTVGLLITFTRSVLVAVFFFLALTSIPYFTRFANDLLSKRFRVLYILIGLGLGAIVMMSLSHWEELYYQLNRGMEDADLSQRDIVLEQYYNFIRDNPIFGNGSYKLWMNINGEIFHGHNSFLQTFATNGLVIGFVFLYLIFRNMNKFNFYYLLPIIVLSLFQYVIFWGVSFMDLMFFFFLFMTKERLNKERLIDVENMEEENKARHLKAAELEVGEA